MASSKKSQSANNLVSTSERLLKGTVHAGQKLTLGLSGGVDSVVLLDILLGLRHALGFQLSAVHINHQISPNAASWAEFCQQLCRGYDLPIDVVSVTLQDRKRLGVEASAREARSRVFNSLQSDFMVLAHNLDDQAETVLLQMLRGAGAKGLSGMGELSDDHALTTQKILRPLLEIPRSDIESYAKQRGLRWIEDESNLQVAYDRNYLRHLVFPVIEERFPAYRKTLLRVSRNLAESAALMDDLARLDAERAIRSGELDVRVLSDMSEVRARNLLRYWLADRGAPIPAAEQLEEVLRQLLEARIDSSVRVRLGESEVRRFCGMARVLPNKTPHPDTFSVDWNGEPELVLKPLGARLIFEAAEGEGISRAKLGQASVTIRLRQGGEKLRPDRRRPRRSLKNLLQETKVPPWVRETLPLLFCGERLVWVPELGIDCDFQAEPGEPSIKVSWQVEIS